MQKRETSRMMSRFCDCCTAFPSISDKVLTLVGRVFYKAGSGPQPCHQILTVPLWGWLDLLTGPILGGLILIPLVSMHTASSQLVPRWKGLVPSSSLRWKKQCSHPPWHPFSLQKVQLFPFLCSAFLLFCSLSSFPCPAPEGRGLGSNSNWGYEMWL